MSKSLLQPAASIRLTDGQFAQKLAGKYGWSIDYAVKRSSLQHIEKTKTANHLSFAKPLSIHITKVLQPLYLKLIYENHQLNQLLQYKQRTLSVNQFGLNQMTQLDNQEGMQRVTTSLIEKVEKLEQEKQTRQTLQRIQHQVEQKVVQALPITNQASTGQEQVSNQYTKVNVTLVRRNMNQTKELLNEVAAISQNTNSPSLLLGKEQRLLHTVPKEQAAKKAKATMQFSQYVQRFITQEVEQLAARQIDNRKQATFQTLENTLEVESRTQETIRVVHERPRLLNQSLQQENERENGQSGAESISSNKSLQVDDHQLQANASFTTKVARQLKYFIRTSSTHIQNIRIMQQQSIRDQQKLVFVPQKQFTETALTEKARLIHRAIKLDNDQHSYHKLVSNQGQSESVLREQDRRSQQDRQAVTDQQADAIKEQQAVNDQRSAVVKDQQAVTDQQAANINERQVAVSVGQTLVPTRQLAKVAQQSKMGQQSITAKQYRQISVSSNQISLITKLHQQLIERHIRLIYQVEMVQKKKTPRSKKFINVPEVTLIYRTSTGEFITRKQKDGIQAALSKIPTVAVGKTIPLSGLEKSTKPEQSMQAAIHVEVKQLRRSAQILYSQSVQRRVNTENIINVKHTSNVSTATGIQQPSMQQMDNQQSSIHHQKSRTPQSGSRQSGHEVELEQSMRVEQLEQLVNRTNLLSSKTTEIKHHTIAASAGYSIVRNEEFTIVRKLYSQMQKLKSFEIQPQHVDQRRRDNAVQDQLRLVRSIHRPQLQTLKLLHRRLQHIQAKAVIVPAQALLHNSVESQQPEKRKDTKSLESMQRSDIKQRAFEQGQQTNRVDAIKQQETQHIVQRELKRSAVKQLVYRKENRSEQLQLLIQQIQQGQRTQQQILQNDIVSYQQRAKQTEQVMLHKQAKQTEQVMLHKQAKQMEQTMRHKQTTQHVQTILKQQINQNLLKNMAVEEFILHTSERTSNWTTATINNITARPHSLHFKRTLSRKQLGSMKLKSKVLAATDQVNHIRSDQSAMLIIDGKGIHEREFSLTVNDTKSAALTRALASPKPVMQTAVSLDVATRTNKSVQVQQEAQQSAVQQLEVTVKRLEKELTEKQSSKQPTINMMQLTDQLYEQLAKKIKIERHRNGR